MHDNGLCSTSKLHLSGPGEGVLLGVRKTAKASRFGAIHWAAAAEYGRFRYRRQERVWIKAYAAVVTATLGAEFAGDRFAGSGKLLERFNDSVKAMLANCRPLVAGVRVKPVEMHQRALVGFLRLWSRHGQAQITLLDRSQKSLAFL
jgi:hypothetical protein